ncbi:MAG: RcnB family protein [Henriciella sp.]|nr:RcnB family protein [Henriciella sp.]
MSKLVLVIAFFSNLAAISEAGPPASFDEPKSVEREMADDKLPSEFERGDYLPIQYRGNLLNHWKTEGLREPDAGFEWVRADQYAFLINPTSGFIRDIVELDD